MYGPIDYAISNLQRKFVHKLPNNRKYKLLKLKSFVMKVEKAPVIRHESEGIRVNRSFTEQRFSSFCFIGIIMLTKQNDENRG